MSPPIATEVQGTMDTQVATFADKLSVNGVPARRSKGTKIGLGIAAHASSDMFKGPVSIPRATEALLTDAPRIMESQKPRDGIVSPSVTRSAESEHRNADG